MRFMYRKYEVEVLSFVNRLGNTSYILRFYCLNPIPCDFYGVPACRWTRTLEYVFVRYQWNGGTVYHLCADPDGWCFPAPCRIKDIIPGFNWSKVRRAFYDTTKWRKEVALYGE